MHLKYSSTDTKYIYSISEFVQGKKGKTLNQEEDDVWIHKMIFHHEFDVNIFVIESFQNSPLLASLNLDKNCPWFLKVYL